MFAIVKKLFDGALNLLSRAIKACMLALIWVYQHGISPHLGANCRYQPTCSAYAREAIVRHGPLKGSFLAIKRIARCHPGYPGGHDPVP